MKKKEECVILPFLFCPSCVSVINSKSVFEIMGAIGYIVGKTIILGTAGIGGFITGGPVGAGIAMSQAVTAAHAVGLAALLAPL